MKTNIKINVNGHTLSGREILIQLSTELPDRFLRRIKKHGGKLRKLCLALITPIDSRETDDAERVRPNRGEVNPAGWGKVIFWGLIAFMLSYLISRLK